MILMSNPPIFLLLFMLSLTLASYLDTEEELMKLALADKDPNTEMLNLHRLEQIEVLSNISRAANMLLTLSSLDVSWMDLPGNVPLRPHRSLCAINFQRNISVNASPGGGLNAPCTSNMPSR